MIALRETSGGVSFPVRVQPRAKRTMIAGTVGDAVKFALAAPPVDGKANEALIRFFAELFEVPRSAVEIVSGGTSRNKVVRVAGVSADLIRSRLAG